MRPTDTTTLFIAAINNLVKQTGPADARSAERADIHSNPAES